MSLLTVIQNFVRHTSSTPMPDPWAMQSVAIEGADADPYGGLPFDHPTMVIIRQRLAKQPFERAVQQLRMAERRALRLAGVGA